MIFDIPSLGKLFVLVLESSWSLDRQGGGGGTLATGGSGRGLLGAANPL